MKPHTRPCGLLFAASLLLPHAVHAADPTHPTLREELMQMSRRDQEVRTAAPTQDNFASWRAVDAANLKRMKEIVEQFGWPTYAMVGKDGAQAAWLLVQHGDEDRPFQLKVLAMMEPLVKDGRAGAVDYAYLYDRTHYPQRYGTQGSCVSRTEWRPLLTEAPETLDQRRRELGLPSMADYAKRFKEACAGFDAAMQDPNDPRKTMPIPSP